MKRLLSMLLAIAMVISMVPTAFAEVETTAVEENTESLAEEATTGATNQITKKILYRYREKVKWTPRIQV